MRAESTRVLHYFTEEERMVGTGRFELPTPRTPSECSTRLSHVPTSWKSAAFKPAAADEVDSRILHYPGAFSFGCPAFIWRKALRRLAPLDGAGTPSSS